MIKQEIESRLSSILERYQKNFSEKIYVDVYGSTDVLMDAFGITQDIKKLILTLIPKSSDNIVLDPFAGSGTTLAAAKQLGYHYIGIEIESEYIDIIDQRLNSVYLPSLTK